MKPTQRQIELLQSEVQAASSMIGDMAHNLANLDKSNEQLQAENAFLKRQLAKRDALIDNVWKSANSSFPDSSIVSIIKSEMKRIMETFQYEFKGEAIEPVTTTNAELEAKLEKALFDLDSLELTLEEMTKERDALKSVKP